MIIKIWQRYFLREWFRVFFFVLICFFGLFVLIDYAYNIRSTVSHPELRNWYQLGEYYFCIFFMNLEVILPFSILIATVKTLSQLNASNEITALRVSGMKIKEILRPFLLTAFFFMGILYVNEELFYPIAAQKLHQYQEFRTSLRKKAKNEKELKKIILDSNAILLYQTFLPQEKKFLHVYWMPSIDEFYKIEELYIAPTGSEGYGIDTFQRDANGNILLIGSKQPQKIFPEIQLEAKRLQTYLQDPDDLSMSVLWEKNAKLKGGRDSEAKIQTAFFWKILIPLLCLLAMIGVIPLCIKHSRNIPIFFIYTLSIFSFITYYLFIDAATTLSNKQVLHPLWALGVPFLLLGGLLTLRYLRTV